MCSIIVIGVTKQTKPPSGSALDYKQQVPFWDQDENITCFQVFKRLLCPHFSLMTLLSLFLHLYKSQAQLYFTSIEISSVHPLHSDLLAYLCTALIIQQLSALSCYHYDSSSCKAGKIFCHRPCSQTYCSKVMGTMTHHSTPVLRRMLWFVVCASYPAQAEEISFWTGMSTLYLQCQRAFP